MYHSQVKEKPKTSSLLYIKLNKATVTFPELPQSVFRGRSIVMFV